MTELTSKEWAIANIRAYQRWMKKYRDCPASLAAYRHGIKKAMERHGIRPEEIKSEGEG